MSVFEVFVSAIFVNNIVLSQNLGQCPYVGCSKEKSVAIGMGSAVIFVTVMATMFTWMAQKYLLDPFELGYLQKLVLEKGVDIGGQNLNVRVLQLGAGVGGEAELDDLVGADVHAVVVYASRLHADHGAVGRLTGQPLHAPTFLAM